VGLLDLRARSAEDNLELGPSPAARGLDATSPCQGEAMKLAASSARPLLEIAVENFAEIYSD